MRIPVLFLLALVLAHASAFAQQAPYNPSLSELDQVEGMYRLDNGVTLKVEEQGHRIVARIGKHYVTELVPVAENRFVSPDGRLTMQFTPMQTDNVVVLTYPPELGNAVQR